MNGDFNLDDWSSHITPILNKFINDKELKKIFIDDNTHLYLLLPIVVQWSVTLTESLLKDKKVIKNLHNDIASFPDYQMIQVLSKCNDKELVVNIMNKYKPYYSLEMKKEICPNWKAFSTKSLSQPLVNLNMFEEQRRLIETNINIEPDVQEEIREDLKLSSC